MLAIEELNNSDAYVQEQTNSENPQKQEEEKDDPLIPLLKEAAKGEDEKQP